MLSWIKRARLGRTGRIILVGSWAALMALVALYVLSKLSDQKFLLIMLLAGTGVLGFIVGWTFMESPRSAFKVQRLQDDLSRMERDIVSLREDHDELHEMHSRKDLQLRKTKRELSALRQDLDAIHQFIDTNRFRQALPLLQGIVARTRTLDSELRTLPAPSDGGGAASN